MDITKLVELLQQSGITPEVIDGRVASLLIRVDAKISGLEAWALVDNANLRYEAGEQPIVNLPDWTIVDDLRNSPVFQKAFLGGNESIPVLNAFTLLRDALNYQNINDLRFSFNALRQALSATSIGDFTLEELIWIEQKLGEHHFPLEGFNITPF